MTLTSQMIKTILLKLKDMLSAPRMTLKEQTHFIKRLAFLIRAGIPLIECLQILREQTELKNHIQVLDKIIDDIANGRALSKSLERFPSLFNNLAICVIRVGETTGMLNQNLSYLANELKKKHSLERKIAGAFVYPSIITLATLGITIFLMSYLFPKLLPVLASLHTALPFSTRIVMYLSAFLSEWWLVCIFVLILIVVLSVTALRQSEQFHFIFDCLCLKIPIVGAVILRYNLANGSRTLGLLLKSGLPFSEAVPITGEATTNLAYRKEWHNLAEAVVRGEGISNHLKTAANRFPDIFSNLIAVGEKSGTLSDTLIYLSEMYDNEVEDLTKNLSMLIEPALMIFIGIIVGFVAISIIAPIYSITQNLHA